MDDYSLIFIGKSKENYELYQFLADADKFPNWQVIAIFYSALCYVKAYLYSKGIPKNSINSHDSIKMFLINEKEARNLNVFYYYEQLYFASRDARYTIKRTSKARIEKCIENCEKVKSLLKIQ